MEYYHLSPNLYKLNLLNGLIKNDNINVKYNY